MAYSNRIALVAGATGLIGRLLIQKLLDSPNYSRVRVLVRKPIDLQHPKLEVITFDFDKPDSSLLIADDVYCTLGTTMKKAGSAEAFERVDYHYPLTIAKLSQQNGAKRFSIVTAMGADAKSLFYYNRVKGRIETALKDIGFEGLFIFRPSLLLGDRAEQRFGEKLGSGFMKTFDFLIPSKYKGIEAAKVANAMAAITTSSVNGVVVYESDVLQEF